MKQLTYSMSTDAMLDHIYFLQIRIKHLEISENIKITVNELANNLETLKKQRNEIRRKRMAVTHEIYYKDKLMNDEIMKLSRKILVDNSRESAFYKKLFPNMPSEMTKKRMNEELILVNNIITALREDENYSAYSDTADKLLGYSEELKALFEARNAAYSAEKEATNELNIAKDEAIRKYRRIWHLISVELNNDKLTNSLFY